MDWLSENHTLIDCEDRMVNLKLPLGESFTYKGTNSKKTTSVITTLKARKMIRSGPCTFLASVTDCSNEQTVSSLYIIREFKEVFQKGNRFMPYHMGRVWHVLSQYGQVEHNVHDDEVWW